MIAPKIAHDQIGPTSPRIPIAAANDIPMMEMIRPATTHGEIGAFTSACSPSRAAASTSEPNLHHTIR